jgi:pimeloyl-ACP methyl ester carboxylesterase
MNSAALNPICRFARIPWGNRVLDLEYNWVGAEQSDYPVLVFLHEGLGSVALWKDFPEKFCSTYGFTGLVFSRYGYGLSTPRPTDEKWPVSYMHDQACQVLPVLLEHLGINKPYLFGHSDGGSIALIYAAHFPDQVSGLIVAAPHILVEDVSIASIEKAREAYLRGPLRNQLKKYHADVDSAFGGWNDIWLNPAFRSWDIRSELSGIQCPILAIQGENDAYGTLQQIEGIQQKKPDTHLVVLPDCGHTPHQDQAEAVFKEVSFFIRQAKIVTKSRVSLSSR